MSVKQFEKVALDVLSKPTSKWTNEEVFKGIEAIKNAMNYCLNPHKLEHYKVILSYLLDKVVLLETIPMNGRLLLNDALKFKEFLQFVPTIENVPLAIAQDVVVPEGYTFEDLIPFQSFIRGYSTRIYHKQLMYTSSTALRNKIGYSNDSTNDSIKKKYEENRLDMELEKSVILTRIKDIEVPIYLTKLWVEFRLWYMKIEKDTKDFPKAEQVDLWLTTEWKIVEKEFYLQSFKVFDIEEIANDNLSSLEGLCKSYLAIWPLHKIDFHWYEPFSTFVMYKRELTLAIEQSKLNLPIQLKEDLQKIIIQSQVGKKVKKTKEKKAKKAKGEKVKKIKDPTNGWTIDQMLQELFRLNIAKIPCKTNISKLTHIGDPKDTIDSFIDTLVFKCQYPLYASHYEPVLDKEMEKPKSSKSKPTKKDSKVAPEEVVEKKCGTTTLVYGYDTSLMSKSCLNLAFDSNAFLLILTPSQLKGQLEDPIELNKTIYMMIQVAKQFKPSIIVIEEADLIFAKKLKDCDYNPKRFKKELTKQFKAVKLTDQIQLIGVATKPFESDMTALKNFFKSLIFLNKPRSDELAIRLEQLKNKCFCLDTVKLLEVFQNASYSQLLDFEYFLDHHKNSKSIEDYTKSLEAINWAAFTKFSDQ